jgi:ATP-dependent Lon protease
MKFTNKDLPKKVMNKSNVVTKDNKKCKKGCDNESSDSEYYSSDESSSNDDSDSEYRPSDNSSSFSSDEEEPVKKNKSNCKSCSTKQKSSKKVKKPSIKSNTGNNIFIVSNYPKDLYDETEYGEEDDDYYTDNSDSESDSEDEDVSISSSEEGDEECEEEQDEEEEEEEIPPQKKRRVDVKIDPKPKYTNKKVNAPIVIKDNTKSGEKEKVCHAVGDISNMIGKDFKLSMDTLVKQNEGDMRLSILNHFKEINSVVKDKLIDEQIQIYEESIKKCTEKQERKNKKISQKYTRIFTKLMKKKTHTNDMKVYKKYPLDQQYNVIKRIREISKVSIVEKPYRLQLIESNIPVVYKSAAINKINQLHYMEPSSGEYCKLKNWIDMFMNIPFDKYSCLDVTRENSHDFLEKSYQILNTAVYGLDDAKVQLMQLLGQLIVNPTSIGCSIAINGPPGTGKTSLIKDGVSKILNRPFIFIPLGGATDSSFLEGHSYTYEGSMCGKIIQSLIDCKCMNPVIYFDELDKISDSPKGAEILNLLVHITDTTQNSQFHDKYFREMEFDLSKCLFIFSYNEESNISPILLDRMYKIKTNGYSPREKIHIVQNYLSPSIEKQLLFNKGDIVIKDDVLLYIIEKFTLDEKGVRNVKRCIEIIYSKLNLFRLMNPENNIFKSQIDLSVSFPIEITRTHVDKLIKINVSQSLYKSMYI